MDGSRYGWFLSRLAVPLFSALPPSAPADAFEKRGDFGRGAIGVLAMRKVPHSRKQGEIEPGEGRTQPVGPGKRKQRIMLRPADAGRHIDRGELRCLALHHPDPPFMGSAVMRKSAGEVAGFQEVVGEGFEDIVERIPAVRPELQEVTDN